MSDMVPQGVPVEGQPFDHERRDVSPRGIMIGLVIIVSCALVSALAMLGMFRYLEHREAAKDVDIPAFYAVKQDPRKLPGPPLLPSLQDNRLPWDDYKDKHRAQEKDAVETGIMDPKTKAFVAAPGLKASKVEAPGYRGRGDLVTEPAKWDSPELKQSREATGGTKAPDAGSNGR